MSIAEKVSALAEPLVKAEGYRLFDVAISGGGKQRLLRVYIDREGGVSLDGCATISRQLSLLLDAENLVSGSYTLEVSSPGLTRALKKAIHWRSAVGKPVQAILRKPVDGRGRIDGFVTAADERSVTITDGEGSVVIEYSAIKKANLTLEVS